MLEVKVSPFPWPLWFALAVCIRGLTAESVPEITSAISSATFHIDNDNITVKDFSLNVLQASRDKTPRGTEKDPQVSGKPSTNEPHLQVISSINTDASRPEVTTSAPSPQPSLLQYNITLLTSRLLTRSGLNGSESRNVDETSSTRVLEVVSKLGEHVTHLNDIAAKSSRHPVRQYKNLAFLDTVFDDYDKKAWPTYESDIPTKVLVNVNINTLGPVNAAQMEYGMDIYLRQIWNDPRLALNKFHIRKNVTLNAEDIDSKIWKPDIFFRNVKHANFHKVTVPNKLIRISPNGNILYSMRITMRLSCRMSFKHYPLDSQKCQLILGAYAQTTDQLIIEWREKNPISYEEPLELPEFTFAGMDHSSFTRDIDTGSFSFLNVTFFLVRENGYHLIQTYMPTFLIVMISWVSFWLNVDATAARVTLGVTTLLTLTTVAYGVRVQLPPVSYVKAIDIWIGACSVMVFGALLEFTLVNYLSRSKLRPEDLKSSFNIFHWNRKLNLSPEDDDRVKAAEEMEKNLKRARYMDRFCRVIFPSTFFIFNLVYWLYYLALAKQYEN